MWIGIYKDHAKCQRHCLWKLWVRIVFWTDTISTRGTNQKIRLSFFLPRNCSKLSNEIELPIKFRFLKSKLQCFVIWVVWFLLKTHRANLKRCLLVAVAGSKNEKIFLRGKVLCMVNFGSYITHWSPMTYNDVYGVKAESLMASNKFRSPSRIQASMQPWRKEDRLPGYVSFSGSVDILKLYGCIIGVLLVRHRQYTSDDEDHQVFQNTLL